MHLLKDKFNFKINNFFFKKFFLLIIPTKFLFGLKSLFLTFEIKFFTSILKISPPLWVFGKIISANLSPDSPTFI